MSKRLDGIESDPLLKFMTRKTDPRRDADGIYACRALAKRLTKARNSRGIETEAQFAAALGNMNSAVRRLRRFMDWRWLSANGYSSAVMLEANRLWWEHANFSPEQMRELLRNAGTSIEEVIRRQSEIELKMSELSAQSTKEANGGTKEAIH